MNEWESVGGGWCWQVSKILAFWRKFHFGGYSLHETANHYYFSSQALVLLAFKKALKSCIPAR